MPDSRTHRGPHPEDADLFAPSRLERLRVAAAEFAWLLDRGYATNASLKLVGDRHQLEQRQRAAVVRSACSVESLGLRRAAERGLADLAGTPVALDGFNVLTTVESALGGALVLRGRDGCFRDIAGVHGGYRKIAETEPALVAVGETLAEVGVSECTWYFDRPVSNSGRIAALVRDLARGRGWPWSTEIVFNPDGALRSGDTCVASADGAVIEGALSWVNLARVVVERRVHRAWVVALYDDR